MEVDHWWRRRGDVAAVAALVILPALIFGVPALVGHPILPGDDLTQNYPLRVLAGRDIAAGRMPLFDPYIWSGTTLLAGWNAGAAYPLTLLFAVLPGIAAWTLGLVITFAVACVGMFGFLRSLRLGSVAAFAGALSFGLAGAMSAQVTHFGLVAGMSWVPLALLAVLRLIPDPGSPSSGRPGRRAGWTAVFGTSTGLIILAGEPRAIVDGYLIVALYAIWRLARLRPGRPGSGSFRVFLRSGLSVACGLGLGLALGAVQWMPGMAAISTSQRGNGSLALFSAGSLPDRWLLLTLVPDLLGGSGSLNQPTFFAGYNLTEVTSYVGILPLVAAFALLARVRPRTRLPEWLIWHVAAVTGVLLALGGNTPLAKVLYLVPLYGGQRLQSRNVMLLDLALAVLLAYWADQPFPARQAVAEDAPGGSGPSGDGTFSHARGRRAGGETLLGILPPLAMLAVVVLGLTWGEGFLRWLGAGAGSAAAGRLQPWLVPYAVIAVAAAALVIFGRRLRPGTWRRACTGFVIADIVVFTVLAVVKVAPASDGAGGSGSGVSAASPSVSGTSGKPRTSGTAGVRLGTRESAAGTATPVRYWTPRPVSALGFTGRFAIYDPGLLDGHNLSALDPPDVNDVPADGMASIQGYTSIVYGSYATATGTHQVSGGGQNTLSPAAAGNGTLDQLDTTVLLTPAAYLTTAATAGRASGPDRAGRRDIGAGQRTAWYLGATVAVSEIRVPDAHAAAAAAAGMTIGLTTPDGVTHWARAQAADAGTLEASFPAPVMTTTVVARAGRAAAVAGPPSAVEPNGRVVVADGQLQNALVPPRWQLAGFDGAFAVFANRFASAPLTVQALPGRSTAGVSVRYVRGAGGEPVRAIVYSPEGVQLVRSVAAIPGWAAVWQPPHAAAVSLPVRADGLVQAVDVPAGQGTVTWQYNAPEFRTGLALSLGAALLIAALALLALREWLIPRTAAARTLRPGQDEWRSVFRVPGGQDRHAAEQPPYASRGEVLQGGDEAQVPGG